MQHYTLLKCRGDVNIVADLIDGGVKLSSTRPFECIKEDSSIVLKSRPLKKVSLSPGDINVLSSASSVSDTFHVFHGREFLFPFKNQRILVDGIDVTDDVKEVVMRKKDVEQEEDEQYKREYIVMDVITLNQISLSDSSSLLIKHAHLLDPRSVILSAGESTILNMPACNINTLVVMAYGSSRISGNIDVQNLTALATDASSIKDIHSHKFCNLRATDCAEINITVSPQVTLNNDVSGKVKITVV